MLPDKYIIVTFALAIRLFGNPLLGQNAFEVQEHFSQLTPIQYAGGIAVADFDQDGDMDIYMVAIEAYDENKPHTWNRLLRNDFGKYVDVTEKAHLKHGQYATAKYLDEGIKMGASWGDFDNDGYPDLFLTNHGYDQLWHNNQDGTFTDITLSAGVRGGENDYSSSAMWWDYDLDGDLDLYVSRWEGDNAFYKNTGNGTFFDISDRTGLADVGTTWTTLPLDVNVDGRPDMYIVNDFSPNYLYINLGDDKFENATDKYGVGDLGNGMGVDVCDYNYDGRFDIYLTNIWQVVKNPFYVNQGEKFEEMASLVRLGNAAWGWSCRFFDMDHDMDEDLYVVNQKFFDNAPLEYNRLFEFGRHRFVERSEKYGLDSYPDARCMEVFDSDKDGDLDVVIGNWGAAPLLYNNRLENKGNWLRIKLEGTQSNRDALGAVVKVKTGEVNQHRLHHGVNYLAQSLKLLHFGLGDHDQVDELTVFWPGGRVEKLYNIAARQTLHIKEGQQQQVFGESYVQQDEETILSLQARQRTTLTATAYPNPFDQKFEVRIKAEEPTEVQLSLADVLGNVLWENQYFISGERVIDFEEAVSTGIYFLHLTQDQKTQTIKLIHN